MTAGGRAGDGLAERGGVVRGVMRGRGMGCGGGLCGGLQGDAEQQWGGELRDRLRQGLSNLHANHSTCTGCNGLLSAIRLEGSAGLPGVGTGHGTAWVHDRQPFDSPDKQILRCAQDETKR